MKRIKLILFSLVCLLSLPIMVNAASGKITVSSTSTVVVGNNVTVTVTLSSATSIGSWEMSLNYDKSYLQLKSTTAESNSTRMAASTATGVKSKSYTFTFKTLKKGSTKVSVDSYLAYAFEDLSQISLTSGSKIINIITQAELEASYSKNNNLSALGVEGFTLTEEFQTDKLEYFVKVPENTKEINITATAQDRKSSISGTGVHNVAQGANKFEIIVKAENGSEKTYIINVDVIDENPINVTVNNKEYTVVKIKENLPEANLYMEYTVKINDFEIPAYKNDNTNLILVGLKDSDGNISLFIYDEKNNKYQEYHEIGVNKITIYPLTSNEEIKGYKKEIITINDTEIEGYIYNKNSNFVIIYGINIETGDKGFYMYDKNMQTLTMYNDEYTTDLNQKIELYTYIIFAFSGVFILLIIIIIILVCKRQKKSKKKKINDIKDNKENKYIKDKNTIEEIN